MEQINEKEGKLPFVSVIISTYNRAQYIGITIDSFLKQSYSSDSYEIIVCDNHSPDDTKRVIDSYKNKENGKVRYLFEKRQGMHYARNYAARHAKGDLLYFTDDDTIADVHLLREIVQVFQNKKVGCASGRILPKWECTPPKWVEKYCLNALLSLNDLGKATEIYAYDPGVFGCHEAIRKDVFFQVGGFHPDLIGSGAGVGDGETGMNEDVKALGYCFAYVGTSVIYHMIPPRRMTQKYLNQRFEYNGNSECYLQYRKKPFTKKELPGKIVRYLLEFVFTETKTLYQWSIGEMSLRFVPAVFYYYAARIKYDLQIIKNGKFRRFVENNDWF